MFAVSLSGPSDALPNCVAKPVSTLTAPAFEDAGTMRAVLLPGPGARGEYERL